MNYTMSKSEDHPDWIHDPRKDIWGPCRKYSTDITDAWEVVRWLLSKKYSIKFSSIDVAVERYGRLFYTHGETPMAICICALKARGIAYE